MARSTESANVDTSYATFESDVTAWLGAGGNAELFAKWLVGKLSMADANLARAFKRLGIDPIQRHGNQFKSLAQSDVLP
jgi:hypothetical protein